MPNMVQAENGGIIYQVKDAVSRQGIRNSNNSTNAEGTISGMIDITMERSTGYYSNDKNNNITGNNSNQKYLKNVNPLCGVLLFIHINNNYGLRIIHCHPGGTGQYNLVKDRYNDYSVSDTFDKPFDCIVRTEHTDDYLLFNFYHRDESINITEQEVLDNYSIKAISLNAINDIINTPKNPPEGYVQIPVKIEPGLYYGSNDTIVNNIRYSTTHMFSVDGMMSIKILCEYYHQESYIFNFYDENGDFLMNTNQQFGNTVEAKQFIEMIVPKGAKYARVFSYVFNWDTFAVFGEPVKYTEVPITNVTPSSYVNKDTGAIASSSGSCSTDFIDVEGYDYFTTNVYSTGNLWYALYDKNQQYVNGGAYSVPNTRGGVIKIKIPAIVKYIRTSIFNGDLPYAFARLLPVEDTSSPYYGKYFSILGDSISTFRGFIPTGNAYWYPHGDMQRVTDLWWSKLIDHFHAKLLIDEAWSGSHISGTAASAANNDSRCKNLGTETQDPDVIIVYMGTNDYDHNVALGTYDGHDTIPSTVATFSDAYAVTLDKILTKYKHAEVWCCTLQPMERHGQTGFPEKNNLGLTPEDYNEVIRKIAHAMNCKVLEHSQCGITYYNMPEYFEDWSGSKEHPNKAGHTLIARHDIRFML